MFYKSRSSIPAATSIACVGGKTAALLKSLGYTVAFNGEDKGTISEVATAFKIWLGGVLRCFLYPIVLWVPFLKKFAKTSKKDNLLRYKSGRKKTGSLL